MLLRRGTLLFARRLRFSDRLAVSSLRASLCSAAAFDHASFTDEFLAQVADVKDATDPASSSLVLRKLVKSEVLKFTDMRDAPEKFFLAHRLLSTVGLGGFGVRFTVQFNLFAGSILGMASEKQISEWLPSMQRAGELGCFLLTEVQAGVLSGLIVETTATWDADSDSFVLHTPSDKAAKNWISQGYTAELGVVIAEMIVDGEKKGPHPFFIELRDRETLSLNPGIRIEDMGTKTIANDLDNARVWFDSVKLPRSSLLDRFATMERPSASAPYEYVETTSQEMTIEVLGQRLLTGRQAIAEAALLSSYVLHQKTEKYAEAKICNGLSGERSLASMPQLRNVLDEGYAALDEMIAYTAGVEKRLNVCLSTGTLPDADLVDAISVAKIKCIEVAVERTHKLRLEVGSYALMHDTGFELVDMLLCCKFAEGDSRILQQKLTRDRLFALKKQGTMGAIMAALPVLGGADAEEARAALSLGRTLGAAKGKEALSEAMDLNWKEVYGLADAVAARHIRDGEKLSFVEGPVVERLVRGATEFDASWKEKL